MKRLFIGVAVILLVSGCDGFVRWVNGTQPDGTLKSTTKIHGQRANPGSSSGSDSSDRPTRAPERHVSDPTDEADDVVATTVADTEETDSASDEPSFSRTGGDAETDSETGDDSGEVETADNSTATPNTGDGKGGTGGGPDRVFGKPSPSDREVKTLD